MQSSLPRFRSQQFFLSKVHVCREMQNKFIDICNVWRHHVGAHPDGLSNMVARNQQKHVNEFCYKRVNLSLEELKNINKNTTLSNTWTVQIAKFLWNKSLFNHHDCSLCHTHIHTYTHELYLSVTLCNCRVTTHA